LSDGPFAMYNLVISDFNTGTWTTGCYGGDL
jgi:hypothetical protein